MLNFSKVDKSKTIQGENIMSFLKRRNSRVMKFFREKGCKDIRLVGNPEKPAIVYKGKYLLSAYVNNFDLFLLDAPDGNVKSKVKLNFEEIEDFPEDDLVEFIEEIEHNQIYTIMLKDCNMYYAGYYSEEGEVNHPFMIFSYKGFKPYYQKEKAESVASTLKDKGYDVEVV